MTTNPATRIRSSPPTSPGGGGAFPRLPVALAVLLAGVVWMGAVPTSAGSLIVPVEMGSWSGLAHLAPADPRAPDLAERTPETADGLLEGELLGSGARVHLVDTGDVSLGLLETGASLVWVTLEDGALVPYGDLAGIPTAAASTGPPPVPAGPAGPGSPTDDGPRLTTSSPTDATLQLLLHGDAEYLDGKEARWDDHLTRIAHLVEGIYLANLGVGIEVVELATWTDEATQPVDGNACFTESSASDPRVQFKEHWEAQRPTQSALREAAHLLTGKDLVDETGSSGTIGCSFIRELETPSAYGVSEASNLPGETGLQQDVLLVAHEIGHNFDGRHEDAAPPTSETNLTSCEGTDNGGTLMEPCPWDNAPVLSLHDLSPEEGDSGVTPGVSAFNLTPGASAGNRPQMLAYATGRI